MPFLSLSEHGRLSGHLLRTTRNPCKNFGQNCGAGGRDTTQWVFTRHFTVHVQCWSLLYSMSVCEMTISRQLAVVNKAFARNFNGFIVAFCYRYLLCSPVMTFKTLTV